MPRLWVVARAFSWLARIRPLAKDFEDLATNLAIFVALASIQLAFGRLANK